MGEVISITNQKGGVGKTTTAVNLSVALAALNKRILLIDLDPQGNATTCFGINKYDIENTIFDIITDNQKEITEIILPSGIEGIEIVPSSIDLVGSEARLQNRANKEFVLLNAIKKLQINYDYIIIDCAPSLNILTINALVASNSAIVPVQSEFLAMEGLSHLLSTIKLIKKRLNENLYIHGILITMADKRNKLSGCVEKEIRDYCTHLVYNITIPRNIALSEASSHGVPGMLYDTRSTGSIAYMKLAYEFLSKKKEVKKQHEKRT